MTVLSSAPGKMILIGEYAVLEGAPALVRAVDRYAQVGICRNSLSNYSVEAPNLSVPSQDFIVTSKGNVRFDPMGIPSFIHRLGFFAHLYEVIWQYFEEKEIQIPYSNFVLDTTSFYDRELRNKIGVGSSAALTAALVNSVNQYVLDKPFNKKDVLLLALKAHRYAQNGIGSGIDIASSVYGGVIEYTMVKEDEKDFSPPKKRKYPQKLHIISVWTGVSASTQQMVGSIGEFKKSSNLRYMEIMNNLTAIAKEACDTFAKNNLTDFFSSCEEYYNQLLQLGNESGVPIISDIHQEIEKIVRKSGGIYKPSGAGNGDFGIAMTDDEDKASYLKTVIEQNGFKTVDLNTACDGVHAGSL